jgi:hypothetical protein
MSMPVAVHSSVCSVRSVCTVCSACSVCAVPQSTACTAGVHHSRQRGGAGGVGGAGSGKMTRNPLSPPHLPGVHQAGDLRTVRVLHISHHVVLKVQAGRGAGEGAQQQAHDDREGEGDAPSQLVDRLDCCVRVCVCVCVCVVCCEGDSASGEREAGGRQNSSMQPTVRGDRVRKANAGETAFSGCACIIGADRYTSDGAGGWAMSSACERGRESACHRSLAHCGDTLRSRTL